MTDAPVLWFLNRATGISLLVLLSASVALGVLALRGRAAGDGGGRVPRFVTQALHRNLALGATALLAAHVVTAVGDEYVDIRWWDALLPWGGKYEPLWLALGTLSLDLMVAITVTTALRGRLGHRSWRVVHVTSWAAWLSGTVHGVMIGTDLRSPDDWASWSIAPTASGIGLVLLALAYRVLARPRPAARATPAPAVRPVGSRR